MNILTGDCLKLCAEQAADTVDAIVTDPPYHLTQASRKGSPRNNDGDTPFGRHRYREAMKKAAQLHGRPMPSCICPKECVCLEVGDGGINSDHCHIHNSRPTPQGHCPADH